MKEKKVKQAGLYESSGGEIMARKPLVIVLAGVLAAMAAPLAQAHEVDEPVQLETIKVTTSKDDLPLTVPSLPEVQQKMRQIPGARM